MSNIYTFSDNVIIRVPNEMVPTYNKNVIYKYAGLNNLSLLSDIVANAVKSVNSCIRVFGFEQNSIIETNDTITVVISPGVSIFYSELLVVKETISLTLENNNIPSGGRLLVCLIKNNNQYKLVFLSSDWMGQQILPQNIITPTTQLLILGVLYYDIDPNTNKAIHIRDVSLDVFNKPIPIFNNYFYVYGEASGHDFNTLAVSEDDRYSNYLKYKLEAGNNISITEVQTPDKNNKLVISSSISSSSSTSASNFLAETFTLTSQNIQNKSVTLSHTPSNFQFMFFVVDGSGLINRYNESFTITGNVLSWNTYEIASYLQENDTITVYYIA
jgi:hypothetical protein